MGKEYVKISVRPETKSMLSECKKLYLKHHPELDHVYISEDKMMYEIFRFYLEL